MANKSTAAYRQKPKPTPKREHVYHAGFVAGRILWGLTKLAVIASLAILAMSVIVFGMLCSSLTGSDT